MINQLPRLYAEPVFDRILRIFVAVVCFLCLSAVVARADTTIADIGTSVLRSALTDYVLPVAGSVVAGILTFVAARLTVYLHTRFGLDISAKQQAVFNDMAQKVVLAVEEKGAAAVNNHLPMDKGGTAITDLLAQAKAAGLPEKLNVMAGVAIHAALATTPGLGATGDRVVGVGSSVEIPAAQPSQSVTTVTLPFIVPPPA